jgi:ribosomal protection tetracycline resistance protein
MSRTLNLGVLAHVDAGKTSLTERILFHAGVIAAIGEVDRGTTQTDTLTLERQRGITIQSAVVSFRIGDLVVNLIDTPGHPDFIAEVERALGVLDAVVLVVSAVEGVQPQTRRLSRAIANLGLPCLVFVNKIDRAGARNGSLIREIERELGRDLVVLSAASSLGTPAATAVLRSLDDPVVLEEIADVLCRHDDALLQRYVEQDGMLHPSDVAESLWRQSGEGTITPVLFGSAMTGAGIDGLFNTLPYLAPARENHPNAPQAAEVFKVQRLPTGERVIICRVWAGRICVRSMVPIIRPSSTETAFDIPPAKITGIDLFRDGHAEQVQHAAAGDIVRVHGFPDARIGDWLGDPLHDREQAFDPPVFEYRVEPADPAQRLAMNTALADLADGDPLIGLRRDPLSGDAYIRLYGEVQREVIDATLRDEHGVAVTFGERSVLHVERLLGEGRAAEISGETDPPFYATVGFRIRPKRRERSTWSFTPGKAKQGFFDAAEEGGRAVLEQGLAGWPVVDWDVEVTDLIFLVGSAPVDYRNLAMLVMADAIRDAGTVVCEPVHDVTIRAPAESVGAVIHALSAQRGAIRDTSVDGDHAIVTGTVPAAGIDDLTRQLPGLTNGRADIETRFHDYVPVVGDPPVRPRTDFNPFNRVEFLSRLRGRF